MEYVRTIWSKLLATFNLNKPLGALEVSDTALQYLELHEGKKGRATQVSLRLPPGVIESGLIKDKAKFFDALRVLRKQILPNSIKPVDVILTIPANNVYVQTFNIPTIGPNDLAEAAELNLRMVSPIDINSAYYGWQQITSNNLDEMINQSEILAAFIDKTIIDDYVKVIQEAAYSIAAVESSTISLSRSLYANKLLKTENPYLAIQIQSSGIYFTILRNRGIAFNFFSPWATAQGQDQQISLDKVKSLMEVEIRRMFNFYSSHWGGQISNIALITPALQDELASDIKTGFPSASVEIINEDRASAVYGAAIRGITPRSKDTDISLNNVTAHEAYRGEQILQYLEFWRSVVITVFATLLLLFVCSDLYLHSAAANESQSIGANLKQTEATQLASLQNTANQFNNMISVISAAQASQTTVSWLVDDIDQAALADGVTLERVSLQTSSNSGLIVGNARGGETVATDFKNKVSSIPQVDQLDMPFSTINVAGDGSVNFTITFQVTKWSLPNAKYVPPQNVPAATSTTSTTTNSSAPTNTTIGQQLAGLTQSIPSNNPNVKPIIFSNLQFTSISQPITVQVSAIDKSTADLLNNALMKSSHFHNVQVSAESITSDGRIAYSVTFTYSQ